MTAAGGPCLVSGASARAPANAIEARFRPVRGEEAIYRTQVAFESVQLRGSDPGCERWIARTRDVTATGEAEVALLRVASGFARSCEGATAVDRDSNTVPIAIYRVGASGRLVSARWYEKSGGVSLFSTMASPPLRRDLEASRLQLLLMLQGMQWMRPGRPVQAGETWRTTLDSWDSSIEALEFRTTLIGTETNSGKRLLRLRQTAVVQLQGPAGNGLVTFWSLFVLEHDSGSLQQLELRLTGFPEPNGNTLRGYLRWSRLA